MLRGRGWVSVRFVEKVIHRNLALPHGSGSCSGMTDAKQPTRTGYPSDITDDEWALVAHLVPEPVWIPNLQEPVHSSREMLNAIRYRTRTGCAWRLLPKDFPPWSSVLKRYLHWRDHGICEAIHDGLRGMVRVAEGRAPQPTAGILDSQSVKSTDVGGPTGFDAGKKGQRSKASHRRRRARIDSLPMHHARFGPRS